MKVQKHGFPDLGPGVVFGPPVYFVTEDHKCCHGSTFGISCVGIKPDGELVHDVDPVFIVNAISTREEADGLCSLLNSTWAFGLVEGIRREHLPHEARP
jgi:hypothetical protein